MATTVILSITFFTSLVFAYFLIPTIIQTANKKGLFDMPDGRKQHTQPTPPLGGIAIFISTVVSVLLWGDSATLEILRYPFMTMLVLFFVGLKDDLLEMNALKKLLFQLVLAGMIAFGGLRIENLYGFAGLYALPVALQYVITILFVVGLTNAYNLIDGIDGLAGGIAVIASLVLGTLFILTGQHGFGLVALALTGSMLAFLSFNFNPAKIFMGDTGSLAVGTVLTTLSLRLVQQAPLLNNIGFTADTGIAIIFAVLAVPMLDITQVMMMRIREGRSPFSADRGHVHHILLRKGLNVRQASLSLYGFTLFNATIACLCAAYGWAGNLIFCLVLAHGLWGLSWLYRPTKTNSTSTVNGFQKVLMTMQNYLF